MIDRISLRNDMKDETVILTVDPDTLDDDHIRIVAFGKDANGELQVHHLNLEHLAWMLAKHQEGKKVVFQEGGMQAVCKETTIGT